MTTPLVSTEWLARKIGTPNVYVLDASVDTVVGKEPIIYDTLTTLPNSYKVDINSDLCDLETDAIHAFPQASHVQTIAEKIGFNTSSTLVIYDNQGMYSAPRAWWIFKSFGFENVFILDGGLPKWLKEKRPCDDSHLPLLSISKKMGVTLRQNAFAITTADSIAAHLQDGHHTVVDARSQARFSGSVEEPRPGVRRGHIPGSVNLPFPEVLDGYQYKTPEQLKELFSAEPYKLKNTLVFSCGSGVTACIILVAAVIAGVSQVSLYDGSWAEWGSDERFPIET